MSTEIIPAGTVPVFADGNLPVDALLMQGPSGGMSAARVYGAGPRGRGEFLAFALDGAFGITVAGFSRDDVVALRDFLTTTLEAQA